MLPRAAKHFCVIYNSCPSSYTCFFIRLKLEKQSLEDNMNHLEQALSTLESEKHDLSEALKTGDFSITLNYTHYSPLSLLY